MARYLKATEALMKQTGQPYLSIVGSDTIITMYGESACEKILNLGATQARRLGAVGIVTVKSGLSDLAKRLSPLADIYLRLTKENGCLLLHGVKPRTGLYAVEMDVSRGYPLPKLTPIV